MPKRETKAQKKAVAKAVAAVQQTKSKKKKAPQWVSFLKGAGRVAATLAPEILPLLLAKHPGIQASATAATAAGAAVPIAQSGSLGNMTGIKKMAVSSKDARGNVKSLRVVTMDLITEASTSGFSAGDLVWEAQLDPIDPAFDGTKFSEYGNMFTKYKVNSAVLFFETVCPATTAGGLTLAMVPDPTFNPSALSPMELLRASASQPGAETNPVWQSCCAHYIPPDNHSDLFTEPDGTDIRLVSAGTMCAVAAADIPAGAIGNFYLLADVTYSVPTLTEPAGPYTWSVVAPAFAAGGDTYRPLSGGGTPILNPDEAGTTRYAVGAAVLDGASRNGDLLYDLPPGDYLFTGRYTGATVSEPVIPIVTGESAPYGVTVSYLWETSSSTEANASYVVSVPRGIPSELPILGFFASAATLLQHRVILTSLWDGTKIAMFGAFGTSPMVAPTLTKEDKLRIKRRERIFNACAQGAEQRTLAQISALQSQLRRVEASTPSSTEPKPKRGTTTTHC